MYMRSIMYKKKFHSVRCENICVCIRLRATPNAVKEICGSMRKRKKIKNVLRSYGTFIVIENSVFIHKSKLS